MTYTPEFKRQRDIGNAGEDLIRAWINSRGANTMEKFESKVEDAHGPVLHTWRGDFTALDIGVTGKDGKNLFIEAKTKDSWTWRRVPLPDNRPQFEGGFSAVHWQAYLDVEWATGLPSWVIMLVLEGVRDDTPPGQVSPAGLFIASLKSLCKPWPRFNAKMCKGGMMFWAQTRFRRIATLQEVFESAGKVYTPGVSTKTLISST